MNFTLNHVLVILSVQTYLLRNSIPITASLNILCERSDDSLQVLLTPTHLAIVMEYAAGGELFERICNAGRFGEDEVIHYTIQYDII